MALDDLTNKQKLFVFHYIGAANWNATKAARMAGYADRSAENIGWENVRKREIQEAIKERIAEVAMSSDEVLLRLAGHARSTLDDVIDEQTEAVNLNQARRRGAIDYIREYSCEEVLEGGDDDEPLRKVRKQKVKMVDSQAALVTLGKGHGLWTDRTVLGGDPENPLVSRHEVEYVNDWRKQPEK